VKINALFFPQNLQGNLINNVVVINGKAGVGKSVSFCSAVFNFFQPAVCLAKDDFWV